MKMPSFRARKSGQESRTRKPASEATAQADATKVTAGVSVWGGILFAVGIGLSLAMSLCPLPFFRAAKDEALKNLDSDIGAAIFLVTALSFMSFGASQWWRFLDARRQYYIEINRAQVERNARAFKSDERLFSSYEKFRPIPETFRFSPPDFWSDLGLGDEDSTQFQEIVDQLVKRAIGPELAFGAVQQKHLDRFSKFRGILVERYFSYFTRALRETNSIPRDLEEKLLRLVSQREEKSLEEIRSLLSVVKDELGKLQPMTM
jgi:hypothetical protein